MKKNRCPTESRAWPPPYIPLVVTVFKIGVYATVVGEIENTENPGCPGRKPKSSSRPETMSYCRKPQHAGTATCVVCWVWRSTVTSSEVSCFRKKNRCPTGSRAWPPPYIPLVVTVLTIGVWAPALGSIENNENPG